MASVDDILALLNEVCDDSSATKNLKNKITQIVTILSAEEELSIKINKVSHELDELASNTDIDSYTRTQLLGIVGALETVEE